MTMHERLREAAKDTRQWESGLLCFHDIAPSSLAAIEADMLAPWRERVAALEADNGRLKQAAVSMSDTCDEWADSYHALKARADAFRSDVEKAYLDGDWLSIADAKKDYDAADRAGETNDDGTRGSSGSHCGDDCDSNPADRGVGCGLVDQSQAVAPSPTDAAADIADDDRNEVEWLTAQVAELRHWREDVDFHMTHIRKFRDSMVPALAKANLRILALEQRLDALRGPEVTVTDEMAQACWDAICAFRGTRVSDIKLSPGLSGEIRAGLEAALRAGGAK